MLFGAVGQVSRVSSEGKCTLSWAQSTGDISERRGSEVVKLAPVG